jgi:hypothetical protein
LRPASPDLDFPVTSMASRGKEKPARRGLSRRDDRAHRALMQINFAYPPRPTDRGRRGTGSRSSTRRVRR